MITLGKMDITIKITEIPKGIKTGTNGEKEFLIDAEGREITITVKSKVFKKLEEAQANFPQWVAAITGKMGQPTPNGFILENPGIQVFEKKQKPQEPSSEQKVE